MKGFVYNYMAACVLVLCLTLSAGFYAYSSDNQEKGGGEGAVMSEDTKQGKKEDISKHPASRMFEYRPPMRGKPGNRVGGGTRGPEDGSACLAVLAPDHTGLTTKAQPSLYWFISESITSRIEFTIIDENSIKPVLEVDIGIPDKKGIQCLRLSDHNVTLLPEKEYQWFVAIVSDPEHRSNDTVACGDIKRVEPSETLTDRLNKAGKMEIPEIYADDGIWYDCITFISELISAGHDVETLCRQRAFLLKQAGLSVIAEYEEKVCIKGLP
ncbi:DUF928 domain-containing protein [bacterium]|nr:DUF928 domain-containing protein [bacterium]